MRLRPAGAPGAGGLGRPRDLAASLRSAPRVEAHPGLVPLRPALSSRGISAHPFIDLA
ncbi:hypothetical protein HMPREF0970_01199 [Schaalia odontolytica F0309]|uniref:Uncharacterized protein n=1 Tax=Schaalia odontolytica F0309 TaxID=649742 RepID=D4TZ20_9ACTO|nr:hypothetical protein HMPREF0970_01199 [Schaalia odontolytica F0309]